MAAGGLVALLHRCLGRDKVAAVAEGQRAVATGSEELRLVGQLGLPDGGIRFQLDTFRVLALQREVLLGVATDQTHERLATMLADYRRHHPFGGYRFGVAAPRPEDAGGRGALLVRLLVRHQTDYRRGDRLMLNRHVTLLKSLDLRRLRFRLSRFVDKQGITAEALLR